MSTIFLSTSCTGIRFPYVEELLGRPVYKAFNLFERMLILLTAETLSRELRFGSEHALPRTSTRTEVTCHAVWYDNVLRPEDPELKIYASSTFF